MKSFRVDPFTRVPRIPKADFDAVAEGFLEQYHPESLEIPGPVPIRTIAADRMGLKLSGRYRLSEDGMIQGMTCFGDGVVDIWDPEEEEYRTLRVTSGTVLYDPEAVAMWLGGALTLTICHECMHWYLHRAAHFQRLAEERKTASVACRCSVREPAGESEAWTDEDWMEWQANGIAPRVLMPRKMFLEKAEDMMRRMGPGSESRPFYGRMLARRLADYFGVSRQAAAIRLSDLGIMEQGDGKAEER